MNHFIQLLHKYYMFNIVVEYNRKQLKFKINTMFTTLLNSEN